MAQKPVTYKFDPFKVTKTKKPKGASKREILNEVQDFVVESVLDDVGATTSPVAGHGKFPKLTKKYRDIKKNLARPIANLEFSGDMLDSLKAPISGSELTLKVSQSQNDKADGHNNHSGKSSLPLRRFIPKGSETFRPKILRGIKRIIKSFEE